MARKVTERALAILRAKLQRSDCAAAQIHNHYKRILLAARTELEALQNERAERPDVVAKLEVAEHELRVARETLNKYVTARIEARAQAVELAEVRNARDGLRTLLREMQRRVRELEHERAERAERRMSRASSGFWGKVEKFLATLHP